MKMSRRAKRMERNHSRNNKKPTLNLTALMDIFTILVFFLMVNQAEVTIKPDDSVVLPKSDSAEKPVESLKVQITADTILLEGEVVMTIDQVQQPNSDADNSASASETLIPLANELLELALVIPESVDDDGFVGRRITVLGDQDTSYEVVKRVISTSRESGFNHISLAVEQEFSLAGDADGGRLP